MARYNCIESDEYKELTRILNNTDQECVNALNAVLDLNRELDIPLEGQIDNNQNRMRELINISRNLLRARAEAYRNQIREFRRMWYPVYQRYAADHKLDITEETCLNICNNHYHNQIIDTRRVLDCSCSDNCTYTLGDDLCASGGEIYLHINGDDEWGFISFENPGIIVLPIQD